MLAVLAGPYCCSCGLALREFSSGWYWCDKCWYGVTLYGVAGNPYYWKEVIVSNYTVDSDVTSLPEADRLPKGPTLMSFFPYGGRVVTVEVRQPTEDPFVLIHGRPYGLARVFKRLTAPELGERLDALLHYDEEVFLDLAEGAVDEAMGSKREFRESL